MERPKLSVIVCTYNREKYIAECLAHLSDQSIDAAQYEVLIINNISTDNTDSIVKSVIEEKFLINFRYFIEESQGHTYARNRGIVESKSDLLAFIDDDAFVNRDFCQSVIDFFGKNKSASAIGGRIIPVYEDREPEWMSKYLLPLVAALDIGDAEKPFKGTKFPLGANMAFRRSIFDKYGIFDINLGRRADGLEGGDEKELFIRLRNGNEEIWYVPEVKAEHIIPPFRVNEAYIKGLASGVGTSERKRVQNQGFKEIAKKTVSELIKVGGTLILAAGFIFSGKISKATMLIRFRYWVAKSLIKGSK